VKIAEVTWHDAHSADAWSDLPTEYIELSVLSVGYIKEYPGGIVVIPNIALEQPSTEELCFGVVHIPQGCIKRIRYLTE